MIRRRPRKDISYVSKRHLNRITKQESNIICNALLNMAGTLHNVNDKSINNLKHVSEVNSEEIDIQNYRNIVTEDHISNESNKENDILIEYENLNVYKSIANVSCNESEIHLASENSNIYGAAKDIGA